MLLVRSKVPAARHGAVSLLYRDLPPQAGAIALREKVSNTGHVTAAVSIQGQENRQCPKLVFCIVDDHALMCQGLRAILEPEYSVVGEVHDGEGVPAAVAQYRPDVVLLDLSLPGKSGAEVLQDLLATGLPARRSSCSPCTSSARSPST